jgi:DNA-binding response OmpR family regulator
VEGPRKIKVLVVEDEAHIRELVCLHLSLEGYDCVALSDGREALRVAGGQPFDLVVLDLMIPGLDGITVCRGIRSGTTNRDVPILMLTARREEVDKVLGLESGADDYLTKPFGRREWGARARPLLRRPRGRAVTQAGSRAPTPDASTAPAVPAGPAAFSVHGVEIDQARRRVRVQGRDVDLTAQEFNLLQLLVLHPGIVFSREALLSRLWKGETFVTERSVDTLVKRVRHKIEAQPADPQLILTVWGVGYKFADV